MKRAAFLLLCAGVFLNLNSQVTENKSGVKQLNISKKGTELKKLTDETRTPADKTPPVLKIESPSVFG
jgi:hypothetical protein